MLLNLLYNFGVASPIPATGKEGVSMIITFIVSVAAGVISHYICKWLDRH